jgi:hypothetical protein
MDFDSFISESISKNTLSKSTTAVGLNIYSHSLRDKNRVKDVYNAINKMINQTSIPFMGDYVIIPPTVSKDGTFTVLDIHKANDEMHRIYAAVVDDGTQNDEMRRSFTFENMIESMLSNKNIVAASLMVEKLRVPGFGHGYMVLSAAVAKNHQGQGLMLELYKKIIGEGIPLMSDDSQSEGVIKVWEKLGQTPGIALVGIDESFKQIIPLTLTEHGYAYMKLVHQKSRRDGEVERLLAYKK